MLFRQLIEYNTHTYTYLVADDKTKEAAIFDSCIDRVDHYLKLIKELDLKLVYAVETHIHADHITGSGALRKTTHCKIVVPEAAKVGNADMTLKHGQFLKLGNLKFKAISTPGHTDAHNTYYVEDRVLTGDALLIHGCGRTDFQGGDPGQLYDSIQQHLFILPDETFVYPGHDYNGNTRSTIGEEKKWNPRLANKTRQEFIALMNNLKLEKPKQISEAVPANEQCGEIT